MPVDLPGVRVGPLDPDVTADFGTIHQARTAREMLRHHARMYPVALRQPLNLRRNDPRSRALVMAEVLRSVAAAEGKLPEGFEVIAGSAAVRGDEYTPQFVTYTYRIKSGRVGKGAVPYNADTFPESFAAGTRQVAAEQAKEAGTGITADQIADIVKAAAAQSATPDDSKLREENDDLRRQLAELKAAQDAAAAAAQSSGDGSGDGEPDATGDPLAAAEPWKGYDGENGKDIAARLSAKKDVPLARKVLAYEETHANRSGVKRAANRVLDVGANAGE